jgi:hypothetical protein
MATRYVCVLMAFAALSAPASSAVAQLATEGNFKDIETCRARAGGSRIRSNNCENDGATSTVRTEHEFNIKLDLPAPEGPQCEASTLTDYFQRDTTAVIKGTVSISSCPAGSTGSFTLVARVKDEAGEIKPLEFNETWQRDDAQDHVFNSTYPIGADVELVSVRVRALTCTCAEAPAPEPAVLDAAPAAPQAPVKDL